MTNILDLLRGACGMRMWNGRPDRPGLIVQTLGRFAVHRDGVEVRATAWTRRKAKELLWLLCARPCHTVGREQATELLWPGVGLERGRIRFRVTLHALRSVLDPLRTGRCGSRFIRNVDDLVGLDGTVQIDVDEFRRLAAQARHEFDTTGTVEPAWRAIEAYEGDFLSEAPYVEWLAPYRADLREAFVTLCLWTAELELKQGHTLAVLQVTQRVIREDPYRESAYRLQAHALARRGDLLAARRAYDTCRQRLRDDLGIEPTWNLDNPRLNSDGRRSAVQ